MYWWPSAGAIRALLFTRRAGVIRALLFTRRHFFIICGLLLYCVLYSIVPVPCCVADFIRGVGGILWYGPALHSRNIENAWKDQTGTQQQHNTRLKAKKAEERGLEKLNTFFLPRRYGNRQCTCLKRCTVCSSGLSPQYALKLLHVCVFMHVPVVPVRTVQQIHLVQCGSVVDVGAAVHATREFHVPEHVPFNHRVFQTVFRPRLDLALVAEFCSQTVIVFQQTAAGLLKPLLERFAHGQPLYGVFLSRQDDLRRSLSLRFLAAHLCDLCTQLQLPGRQRRRRRRRQLIFFGLHGRVRRARRRRRQRRRRRRRTAAHFGVLLGLFLPSCLPFFVFL